MTISFRSDPTFLMAIIGGALTSLPVHWTMDNFEQCVF